MSNEVKSMNVEVTAEVIINADSPIEVVKLLAVISSKSCQEVLEHFELNAYEVTCQTPWRNSSGRGYQNQKYLTVAPDEDYIRSRRVQGSYPIVRIEKIKM